MKHSFVSMCFVFQTVVNNSTKMRKRRRTQKRDSQSFFSSSCHSENEEADQCIWRTKERSKRMRRSEDYDWISTQRHLRNAKKKIRARRAKKNWNVQEKRKMLAFLHHSLLQWIQENNDWNDLKSKKRWKKWTKERKRERRKHTLFNNSTTNEEKTLVITAMFHLLSVCIFVSFLTMSSDHCTVGTTDTCMG